MIEIDTSLAFPLAEDFNWNEGLVHQVLVAKQAEWRISGAKQKTRSEVRGGGRKPWRQKGTGRARAGTIRSPLWRGGGVTFANTGMRNYSKKVNKKMYAAAMRDVLLYLQKNQSVQFIKDFELAQISTKEALSLLGSFYNKSKATLVVVSHLGEEVALSFRNLAYCDIVDVDSFGILHASSYDSLLIASSAHATLVKKYSLVAE